MSCLFAPFCYIFTQSIADRGRKICITVLHGAGQPAETPPEFSCRQDFPAFPQWEFWGIIKRHLQGPFAAEESDGLCNRNAVVQERVEFI